MNVPAKIMAFRCERASELEAFARLIEKMDIGKPHQIYTAAKHLRNPSSGFHAPGTTDYSCWGYTIQDLLFTFNSFPRHIRPDTIHSLSMSIDVDLLCKCTDWGNIVDPFQRLNFRVTLRGVDQSKEYMFGFHVDRHNEVGENDEVHPIYHLQYNPAVDSQGDDFGALLMLDTPRMMHAPLDVILGLDLMLSNFFPSTWDKLRDQSEYVSIYATYSEAFWKPYVHAWASNWTFKQVAINWEPSLICPYILK